MARRVLYFGRFQPFHRGHLSVVEWALKNLNVDEVVVLIGMASESYTPRNPFTAGERIEMIRLSLRDAGIPLERLITATIHTLETSIGCADYVLSFVPKIDYIVTGNPAIARIFKDSGARVVNPPYFRREEWNGSRIRRLMASGNPAWREAVTPSTASFIESIDGPGRLAEIYRSDTAQEA
jgi:nicotinamide-nucleotide adenylyltransferase